MKDQVFDYYFPSESGQGYVQLKNGNDIIFDITITDTTEELGWDGMGHACSPSETTTEIEVDVTSYIDEDGDWMPYNEREEEFKQLIEELWIEKR